MQKEKPSQKVRMPKKFYKGFLTNAMKKYINTRDKRGYNRSEYDGRLIGYATMSLKHDLPLLAEKLGEEMQTQIFNKENLMPFFRALFKVDYRQDISKEELEKRRQRLIKLCYELLTWLGYEENARKLAPNSMNLLLKRVPIGLQAIIMEAY
jgi:hypothetical protein